jgi:hypothetical protein
VFERDAAFLRERGRLEEAVGFDGGHEWHATFLARASAFLARIAASPAV